MLVVALFAAAIACAGATAAAAAIYSVNVHARLAPVAGTTAAGQFGGTLTVVFSGPNRFEPSDNFPPSGYSTLRWQLSLPALHGPISALLRLHATKSAAPVARMLCGRCLMAANGTLKLTVDQGLRIATSGSGAVIVVRTPSATLRGPVKVSPQVPVAQ